MEQSEIESKADTPDEVPQETKQASIILGKFASVDELIKAYEQLQSAFTRKSQELSVLRKDTQLLSALRKDTQEKDTEQPAETTATASVAKEETAKETARAVPAVEETVKETPRAAVPAVIAGGAGGLCFSNVTEATTIHATTKVVENFFKDKSSFRGTK